MVRCGTGPSSRVRAFAPPVQYLLRDGYKCDQHAFQGEQRHHGCFGESEEKNGVGGAGGNNQRRVSPGDVALGYALRSECRSRLAIAQAAGEDDRSDHGRVRGIWPHLIGGQD